MAKSKKETKEKSKPEPGAFKDIEDSAHKIWLAGLGAFFKAEQEGEKLFKSLVKQGTAVEEHYREHVADSVKKAKSATVSTMELMENMFEQRMQEAIARVQTPAAESMDSVVRQLSELRRSILGLMGVAAKAPANTPTPVKKKVVKKSVTKKVAKKAVKKVAKKVVKKKAAKQKAAKKVTKKVAKKTVSRKNP